MSDERLVLLDLKPATINENYLSLREEDLLSHGLKLRQDIQNDDGSHAYYEITTLENEVVFQLTSRSRGQKSPVSNLFVKTAFNSLTEGQKVLSAAYLLQQTRNRINLNFDPSYTTKQQETISDFLKDAQTRAYDNNYSLFLLTSI